MATEGEGLTFREACIAWSLSEKTLRKRIMAGRIQAWEVEVKGARQWRVAAPGTGGEEPGAGEHEAAAGMGELVPVAEEATIALGIYRELLDRHEQAVGQLGYQRAQAERLPALEEQTLSRDHELKSVREALAQAWGQAAEARVRLARCRAWCWAGWAVAAVLAAALVWALAR